MENLLKHVIFTILSLSISILAADDFEFPSTKPVTLSDYSQILIYQNDTSFVTKFCNSYCDGLVKTSPVDYEFEVNLRCMKCSCDIYCDLFGDCCPDSLGNIRPHRAHDTIRHRCLFTNEDVVVTHLYGIAMLLSCPDSFTAEIEQQLSYEEQELAPVTSLVTNMTYYNEHIAKCNGERSYAMWDEELECSSGYGSGGRSDDDDDGDDASHVEDHSCQYTFHADLSLRVCDPMMQLESVQECNVTGEWSKFDATLVSYCHGDKYPVEFKSVIYRNIFCCMCNGFIPEVYSNLRSALFAFIVPPRITLITRFNQWPMQPTRTNTECDKNSWWDPEKEICRQLYCPNGRSLKNKECLPVSLNAFGDIYSFEITLQPHDQRATAAVDDWIVLTEMITLHFEIKMAELHSKNYVFTLARDSYAMLRVSCKLLVTEYTDRIELEESLLNLVSEKWLITFKGEEYLFVSSVATEYDVSFTNKATYSSEPVSGICCNSVSDSFALIPLNTTSIPDTIQVTEHLTCPYVKLDASDIVSDSSGWVELVYANVSLPRKYVSFLPSGEVSVCIETLTAAYNGSGFKDIILRDNKLFAVQNLLSFICVVVSLVCLACTFVTYCAFPSLRTLPARNNMFLIAYLFLAQFMFQVGVGQTEHELVCIVIGVLIHYLWLNVVLWMNVCSFHMFRVFFLSPARPSITSSRSKHIVRYSLYTNIVSFVIIALTIGMSMLFSQGQDPGYGGYACYLATPTLVGFAFVLPLSIVLCSNVFFFAVTVYSISKTKLVHRQTGKDRHNIYVYIKLSTMTGMFWTVSILSEMLDIEALSYVAIVLNGTQGLLLFVCYVLNRRVLNLWKGVCSKIVAKYSPDVTRNTTESTNL